MTGVVPLSPTFDVAGPICRSVRDAHRLWCALISPTRDLSDDTQVARLATPATFWQSFTTPDVAASMEQALGHLRDSRITVAPCLLPSPGHVDQVYRTIVLYEAARWHARSLIETPGRYLPETRQRLEQGFFISEADYQDALKARDVMIRDVDRLLDRHDALVLPTVGFTAPTVDTTVVTLPAAELPVRDAMLRLTKLFNVTGHPAITMPLPVSGWPVGLQLVGRRGDTGGLLVKAMVCETILGKHHGHH